MNLKRALEQAPLHAGVYQFFDASGALLYVGKAKVLKHRLKSYFSLTTPLSPAPKLSARIHSMISQVHELSYIVVPSEHDALILENSLIKQLKPKYNILLRDDKTYPYLCVNLDEPFARFEITRKVLNTKALRYFGPFSSSARALLDAVNLCFPLVQKKGCAKGKKACLFYEMKRCLAPCEGKIDAQTYRKILDEAMDALIHPKKLVYLLHTKMLEASEKLNFEEAATLRDITQSIEATLNNVTHVELLSLEDFDLFAVATQGSKACVMRFFIRGGKIVSTSHTILTPPQGCDIDELYARAVFDFYHKIDHSVVQKLYVAHAFEEQSVLSRFLSEKWSSPITIIHPKRGEKKMLCDLAHENAHAMLLKHAHTSTFNTQEALKELCDLSCVPSRIEIFDNSHLGGSAPVGAMVVWEEGFCKQSYRRYALHVSHEYGQMEELLRRRIEDFAHTPPPDLWVLDGGETLLHLAREKLSHAGVCLDVIAIAKEKRDAKAYRAKGKAHDILYTHTHTFKLPPTDKRLQFLQKLRDEAHRFAIRYHQQTKRKNDLSQELLSLKGISVARLQKLLDYFGTFEALYDASKEDLCTLIGEKTGAMLYTFFQETHKDFT